MNLKSLYEQIESNGWLDVPDNIISREGHSVDTSSDIWHLPYTTAKSMSLNFSKIGDLGLRWATKRYIQDRLEFTSAHAAYSSFQDVWRELIRFQADFEFNKCFDYEELKINFIKAFEYALSESRKNHRLWVMYRPIQWYVWCAENYPEVGFCPAYALELDAISVPGNPKGESVRMEDVDRGPLHRSLELPLLIKAMRADKSVEFIHLQQKAALALSIALGRNPANLTYLKETDLVNLTPDSDESTWVINMPRIKKRQLNSRDDLLTEYLDTEFANYLLELISANKKITTTVEVDGKYFAIERPLFINIEGNKSAILSKLIDSSFNMTSAGISDLLKQFIERHKIISPLSGEIGRAHV